MEASLSGYLIVFVTAYLLTVLSLLAYKGALNDLYYHTREKAFREVRAVHPIGLLAGLVSLLPRAIIRHDVDSDATVFGIIGGVSLYFLFTMYYRRRNRLKIMDFSIDNGSNFNDEISADPTPAQKVWLFLVSWAGALTFGSLIGIVVSWNSWKNDVSWLSDQPTETEARVYVYVFLGLLALSMLVFRVFRSRRLRRLPTAAKVRRAVNRSWFAPAWFGLMFAALMDFTRNTTLTNRFWVLFILLIVALLTLWNLVFVAPNAKKHLMEDRKFFEAQQKRLRRQRNKRRRRNRR